MSRAVTLTLDRGDAEILVKSLQRRKERLCDIRREVCPPDDAEPYEQEECAYFTQEEEVVGRVTEALRAVLKG